MPDFDMRKVIKVFLIIRVYMMSVSHTDSSQTLNKNKMIYAVLDSTVVLKCPMDKIGNMRVWSRNGKNLAFGKQISNDSSQNHRLRLVGHEANQYNLMILNVTRTDEDVYCCDFVFKDNSAQYCTTLSLIELHVIPHQKNTIPGIVGENISISCSLSKVGLEGNLSLVYNGAVLKSKITDKLNFSITVSKENHEQTIGCAANIQQINAFLEQMFTFNISYKPSVKVRVFPSTIVKEKDNISLSCSFESNPIARQIRWEKGERIVSTNPEYNLWNVSRQHKGLYKCFVENDIGCGKDEIELDVFYAPDVNIVQLYNGSLYCNATGVPMNYTLIKWEHQPFNSKFVRYLKDKSATLTIDMDYGDPLYEKDGRYACTVSNGVQDAKNNSLQKGYIDVNWPGRPWCIKSNPNPQYGRTADNVTIVFHVYSYNISTYKWFKEDELLGKSSKYQFLSNISSFEVNVFEHDVHIATEMISLIVFNVTENDLNATYTLKVNNNFGNETCNTKLQEGSIPQKPNDFNVKPHGSGFKISWISRFNGGYQQNFIIKYRHAPDANWTTKNVTGQRLSFNNTYTELIQDLLNGEEYEIYMFAENVIGMSDHTDLVTKHTRVDIPVYPTTSHLTSLASYIGACFCCVIIMMLLTSFYVRVKNAVLSVMKKKVQAKKRPRQYTKERRAVFEDVVFNPETSGKKFIIRSSINTDSQTREENV